MYKLVEEGLGIPKPAHEARPRQDSSGMIAQSRAYASLLRTTANSSKPFEPRQKPSPPSPSLGRSGAPPLKER